MPLGITFECDNLSNFLDLHRVLYCRAGVIAVPASPRVIGGGRVPSKANLVSATPHFTIGLRGEFGAIRAYVGIDDVRYMANEYERPNVSP
jgi:hypothetical protein